MKTNTMKEEPKYRLFLYKNPPAEEGSKRPYFTLKLITDEEDWKEIGVFWKAPSGKGYSGFMNEGVELDTTNYVSYKERMQKQEEETDKKFNDLD